MGPEAPLPRDPRRGPLTPPDGTLAAEGRRPRRIAVVGGGISGLVAARRLARVHEVVLFEADDRLGGHAHTHDVETPEGPLRLDTGFLVFNEATYPSYTRLLAELGVASIRSDMALSVRCRRCRLEYALRGPRAVFAQKRNLLRPSFYGMFRDLGRLFRDARAFLAPFDAAERALLDPAAPPPPASPDDVSVGAFLDRGGYGDALRRHWLLPTASALWSAPFGDVEAYSARMLLGFFRAHAFLERRQLPWRTIAGGARTVVDALARDLAGRIRLSSPVRRVERTGAGVRVHSSGSEPEPFDEVVLACHADDALRILGPAAAADERAALARFRYASHRVVLHTDPATMPRSRAAWASWNCDLPDCRDASAPASLTYHLNRLQGLSTATPWNVTLNPRTEPAGIVRELRYAHPLLTADALDAQRALAALQGRGGVWYAGAHLRHGFHEDGTASGISVAARLGVPA